MELIFFTYTLTFHKLTFALCPSIDCDVSFYDTKNYEYFIQLIISKKISQQDIELDNVICPYTGSTSESKEFSEWLRKFEVISKLQKCANLHDILPLFLESVQSTSMIAELVEEAKGDYNKLKGALRKALLMRPSEAYEMFYRRKW